MSEPCTIDIIIVNYNAGDMLQRAVKCLQQQTHKNFILRVIDNGSTDRSLDCLPNDDLRIEIIRLGENTGFAKANNIGIAMGNSPWIACINPDAFAEDDWLEKLLKGAIRDPAIVMAGSTQFNARNAEELDGAGDLYSPIGFAWRGLYRHKRERLPATGTVFGPCAAAALYRRDAFEAVGGFDESFFCYHEDVDLAFRLRLRSGIAIQVKDAIVHHVGSGISGTESPFAVYHGTRNRSWTFFKNMPLVPLVLLTPFHVALSLMFLVRAIFKKRFDPTWRGSVDAIAGIPKVLKTRKQIQNSKTCSTTSILQAMTWSPVRFLTRDSDVRTPKN